MRNLLAKLDQQEFAQYFCQHNISDVANKFGICQSSVYNLARQLNLPKKPRFDVEPSYFEQYFLAHSNHETAEHFAVSLTSVRNIARDFGIKRKTARYRDYADSLLTDVQRAILTGSLLGDGSLAKIYGNSLSFFEETHSIKQKEYLGWKFDQLKPFTCLFCEIDNQGFPAVELRTIAHPIFSELERAWYKRDDAGEYVFRDNGHRIKVVPNDIEITPLTLAVWYMDDGTRSKIDRQLSLCTHGFSIAECELLVGKLKYLGIEYCWVRPDAKNRPVIAVGAKSYQYFLDLVRPYVRWSCMQHKLFG